MLHFNGKSIDIDLTPDGVSVRPKVGDALPDANESMRPEVPDDWDVPTDPNSHIPTDEEVQKELQERARVAIVNADEAKRKGKPETRNVEGVVNITRQTFDPRNPDAAIPGHADGQQANADAGHAQEPDLVNDEHRGQDETSAPGGKKDNGPPYSQRDWAIFDELRTDVKGLNVEYRQDKKELASLQDQLERLQREYGLEPMPREPLPPEPRIDDATPGNIENMRDEIEEAIENVREALAKVDGEISLQYNRQILFPNRGALAEVVQTPPGYEINTANPANSLNRKTKGIINYADRTLIGLQQKLKEMQAKIDRLVAKINDWKREMGQDKIEGPKLPMPGEVPLGIPNGYAGQQKIIEKQLAAIDEAVETTIKGRKTVSDLEKEYDRTQEAWLDKTPATAAVAVTGLSVTAVAGAADAAVQAAQPNSQAATVTVVPQPGSSDPTGGIKPPTTDQPAQGGTTSPPANTTGQPGSTSSPNDSGTPSAAGSRASPLPPPIITPILGGMGTGTYVTSAANNQSGFAAAEVSTNGSETNSNGNNGPNIGQDVSWTMTSYRIQPCGDGDGAAGCYSYYVDKNNSFGEVVKTYSVFCDGGECRDCNLEGTSCSAPYTDIHDGNTPTPGTVPCPPDGTGTPTSSGASMSPSDCEMQGIRCSCTDTGCYPIAPSNEDIWRQQGAASHAAAAQDNYETYLYWLAQAQMIMARGGAIYDQMRRDCEGGGYNELCPFVAQSDKPPRYAGFQYCDGNCEDTGSTAQSNTTATNSQNTSQSGTYNPNTLTMSPYPNYSTIYFIFNLRLYNPGYSYTFAIYLNNQRLDPMYEVRCGNGSCHLCTCSEQSCNTQNTCTDPFDNPQGNPGTQPVEGWYYDPLSLIPAPTPTNAQPPAATSPTAGTTGTGTATIGGNKEGEATPAAADNPPAQTQSSGSAGSSGGSGH